MAKSLRELRALKRPASGIAEKRSQEASGLKVSDSDEKKPTKREENPFRRKRKQD